MKIRILIGVAITVFAFILSSCNDGEGSSNTSGTPTITLKDVDSGVEVKGLAADGVSTISIEIPELTIKDILSLEINQTGTAWGNFSTDKYFSLPTSNIYLESPVADLGSYKVYFKGELTLPELLTTDGNVVDKLFDIKIIFTDGEIYETSFTIEIVRPAAIFAHGMASSAETFNPILSIITPKGLFIDEAIYALDYAETSLSTYKTNINVVPNAISYVKQNMLDAGYVNSKVSLIGHSMGGVLTRLYLQGDTYNDDILNFISIDVPHSGTQLADYAIDIATDSPESPIAKVINKGAIFDLQVDSEATLSDLNGTTLNNQVVPTHVIASTIGTLPNIIDMVQDEEYTMALITYAISATATNLLYNGDGSDILVPEDSQIGGVTRSVLVSPITEYDDQWHCSVLTSSTTANDILDLLNNQATTTVPPFTTNGFAPPVLFYSSTSNTVKQVKLQDENITDIQDMMLIGFDRENNIIDMQYSTSGYFDGEFIDNPDVVTTQIQARSISSPQTIYYKTVE